MDSSTKDISLRDQLNEDLNKISPAELQEELKTDKDDEKDYVDRIQERALKAEHIITLKHQNKALEKRNDILEENAKQRKNYSGKIFWLTCSWATAILLIVVLQGFKFGSFSLTEKTLIVLITTTTANIYGFFLIVVKYLFHVDGESAKEENKNDKKPKKKSDNK